MREAYRKRALKPEGFKEVADGGRGFESRRDYHNMSRNFESKSFEQTGDIFEWQYIGQIDTKNPEYQKALEDVRHSESRAGMEDGYIRFRKAIDLAKKFQPYDPVNPDKHFARDIRIAVQDLLGLKTEEEMDRVKFYTAVGSPLDKFHSVDAFIEYTDENGETVRATFDLTVNPNKKGYKTDIVVQAQDLPDPNLNNEEYIAAVEEYAKKILPKMIVKKLHEHRKIIFGQKNAEK